MKRSAQKWTNSLVLVSIALMLVYVLSVIGRGDHEGALEVQGVSSSSNSNEPPKQTVEAQKQIARTELPPRAMVPRKTLPRHRLMENRFGLIFPLRIAFRPLCSGGDFQALAGQLEQFKVNSVRIAIEPLLPSDSYPGVTQQVSLAQMNGDTHLSLSIPPTAKTVVLGVFICTDAFNTNHCRDKEPLDWRKLAQNPSRGAAGASVIYFDHLILSENKLYQPGFDLDFTDTLNQEQRKLIQQYRTPQILNIAKHFDNTLRSAQLGISRPAIEISLPIADKQCDSLGE